MKQKDSEESSKRIHVLEHSLKETMRALERFVDHKEFEYGHSCSSFRTAAKKALEDAKKEFL